MMADQVDKCDTKNILLTEYAAIVKKEDCEEDDLVEDKVHVSQTTIVIDNIELQDHAGHDNMNTIKPYEVSTILDNIKMELSSSEEQYDVVNHSVKKEEGISTDEIRTEFDNVLLYCEDCATYYEDYCIECNMLAHILNRSALNNADNRAQQELPSDIVEIQDSIGQFGIFALKVIPEGVRFGPFIGLSRIECSWKIKSGKFIVNSDKSKYLNWMHYINPTSNISEKNLHVFQCEGNLYYQSTRKIQEGEELLVYFGEEYKDRLNTDAEVDFIPTVEHIVKDIFACSFCCLGFSSRTYLAKHKTVCRGDKAKKFSIEDLMQCPLCNIHLAQEEYYEHHMAYCCKRNVRVCNPLTTPANQPSDVRECKTRPRHLYKCEQCKYGSKFKADLKNHTNQHYKVKTCKCGICCRRFKTKESLRLHVENTYIYVGAKADPKQSTSDHQNANIKAEHSNTQDKVKQLKYSRCGFRTKHKQCLKVHTKTEHLNEVNYKCDTCDYKTNRKLHLARHIKAIHLKEFNYWCGQCVYKTNQKLDLERHIKTKHLKEFDYRCDKCDFKTNYKADLKKHTKTKHLKEFNYRCDLCNLKTNQKSNFEVHIKTKHLKEFNYKCEECDFKTNHKPALKTHIKIKHLKEFNCRCDMCDFKTHLNSELEKHVKTKHLKEFDYRCDLCDYKTNQKPHLQRHLKVIHLNEFNYKCALCGFKTNKKSDLAKHVKTKHLKEFDYICNFCDYKTNNKEDLETHTKTKHLNEFNYKCDMCDLKTNHKSYLKKHVKTKHLKEFTYICDICDYKTNNKGNLERHVNTKHLKDFDYRCDSCNYKTNNKSYLEKHLKVKHSHELTA